MPSYRDQKFKRDPKTPAGVFNKIVNRSELLKKHNEERERRNKALEDAKSNPNKAEKHEEYHTEIKENTELLKSLRAEFEKEWLALKSSFETNNADDNIQKIKEHLKELSDKIEKLTPNTQGTYTSELNSLLENLSKEDPNYVIYIDPLRFTKYKLLDYTIKKLDKEHLKKFQTLLENSEKGNLFENEGEFRLCQNYFKFFKGCLRKLKTLEEIKVYASIYPEELKEIKKYIQELQNKGILQLGGENIDTFLTNLLYNAHDLIVYYSYEDMVAVAKNQPTYLGKALLKHPEMLDLLPHDFFSKFHPKFVFRGIPKIQLYKAFKPYLDNFDDDFKNWLLKGISVNDGSNSKIIRNSEVDAVENPDTLTI